MFFCSCFCIRYLHIAVLLFAHSNVGYMRNQELHRSKFLFLNCFFTQWSSSDTEILKFRSLPDAVFICIREISKDAKSAEGQPLFLISKHTVPFNSFCFFSTSSMFLFLFYFLSFSLSSFFFLFFLYFFLLYLFIFFLIYSIFEMKYFLI